MSKDVYGYDKISIIFKKDRATLQGSISEDVWAELERNCVRLLWVRPSPKALHFKFYSKIDIVSPNRTFLETLSMVEYALWPYKISYLELAVDLQTDTRAASLEMFDFLLKHTIRKYSRHHTVFEGEGPLYEKGISSDCTLYSNMRSKTCRMAIYERAPKSAHLQGTIKKTGPRLEWRLIGASSIKKKTGIETVRDLFAFSIKDWIEKNQESLLFYEINHEKHGRFLEGINSKVRISQVRHKEIIQRSRIFCRVHKIKTAGGLLTHYIKEIKRLKNERGRRSEMDERIVGLTSKMVRSFLKKLG